MRTDGVRADGGGLMVVKADGVRAGGVRADGVRADGGGLMVVKADGVRADGVRADGCLVIVALWQNTESSSQGSWV